MPRTPPARAALLGALVLGAALTACTHPTPPAAAPPPPAPPSSAPSPAPSSSSAPASVSPSTRPGCPVTAGVLLAALKANADFYRRSASPAALSRVACYQDYATGWTPAGESQPTGVLFHAEAGGWRPLNIGSGEFCYGHTTRAVAEHLPGCGW